MIAQLENGQTIDCEDEAFAAGADGSVHWSKDKKWVVKLFRNIQPWRQEAIRAIVGKFKATAGDAYWQERLAWPAAVVVRPSLGVMVPRAAGKPVARFIAPKWLNMRDKRGNLRHPEDRGTFRGRLWLCINLCQAVRRMHFSGLCHGDLSENNVFGDPVAGTASVIDCDGLVVPGVSRPVVQGTGFWMAPELILKPDTVPTPETDQHSLAVLIHQLLLLRHPLMGRPGLFDNDPDRDDYFQLAAKARFIEDARNPNNQIRSLSYPCTVLGTEVARLIEKAFIAGLNAPKRRPMPSEWERDLAPLTHGLVPCPNRDCTFKEFPLPDTVRASLRCPWCGAMVAGPILSLRFYDPEPGQTGRYRRDGSCFVVQHDKYLLDWHVVRDGRPNDSKATERVAQFAEVKEGGKSRMVLYNVAIDSLSYSDPGEAWTVVGRDEGVYLKAGRRLRFGEKVQRIAMVEKAVP